MNTITSLLGSLACTSFFALAGCQGQAPADSPGTGGNSSKTGGRSNSGDGGTSSADGGTGNDMGGQRGEGASGNGGGPMTDPSPCLENPELEGCGGLLPSRVDGVAPLYVFFEPDWGSDQAAREAFHDASVEWDFGDPGAGSWSTTGLPKNVHRGPYAGHVFESKGTYVVTAKMIGPDGKELSQTATIDVGDPEKVFAGSSFCFSQDGDFEGAPEGCEEVTLSSLDSVGDYLDSGVRLLFRRGESWSGRFPRVNIAGPGHIGAFGDGDDPIFSSGFSFSDKEPLAEDWRLTDVQVLSDGGGSGITLSGETRDLLVHHVTIRDVHIGVSGGGELLAYLNDEGDGPHDLHGPIALSELNVRNIGGGSGGNGMYLVAKKAAFMGCMFENSTEAEHIWRIPHIEKGVIAHNDLGLAARTKHVIKMHAPGFSGSGVFAGRYSELVHLSDNTFRGGDESWLVTFGPQNDSSDERIRDIVFERNYLLAGPSNQSMVLFWGQHATARNNIIDVTGSEAGCFGSGPRGIEPAPVALDFYNNTCFSASGSTGLVSMSRATDSSAVNNLVVALGGSASVGSVGDGNTASNNVATESNPFPTDSPSEPSDFKPASGSAADNAGTSVVGVVDDFSGEGRPSDNLDVGAVEN